MSTMDGEKQTAAAMLAVTFEEFEPTTYEEWKAATIVALKGGVFEKRMFTKTYEGIQLEPIYTSEDTKNLTHPHSCRVKIIFCVVFMPAGMCQLPGKLRKNALRPCRLNSMKQPNKNWQKAVPV